MIRSKKILVFGSIVHDEIWDIPELPDVHEKITANAVIKAVGGTGANTASWLAYYGHKVKLLGAVGDDSNSIWILKQLRAQKINVDLILKLKNTVVNESICLISGFTKRIIRHRNIDIQKFDWNNKILRDAIKSVDHVHIASIANPETLLMCKLAKDLGKTVSLELNGHKMAAQRKYADVLFCNAVELKDMYGLTASQLNPDRLKVIMPNTKATLVVTNASVSVVAVNRDSKVTLPVKKWKKIVDRTGSGDSFDAGFISSWLTSSNQDLSKAIKNGVATSAKCVQIYGGQAKKPVK